jgi:glycogen phosphorylase
MTTLPVSHTTQGLTPRPMLPDALSPLWDVAYNFWWTWDAGASALFARIDAELWEQTGHNPVRFLASLSREKGALAANDAAIGRDAAAARARLKTHLEDRGWFASQRGNLATNLRPFQAAYFCAEFGLTECFQIYSGGLGLLAGDHLKSASELGLPLVGVGLLYRNGYFHQKLDQHGLQQEVFPPLDAPMQPVKRVIDGASRRQMTVNLQMPGRQVSVAVWRADVGNVRLYLLDTNIPENSPEDREITANLYLGDQNRRIQQEIVLGIAGVRALAAAGESPTVFHMNEGHAAFMGLERIRVIRQQHRDLTFDQAREAAAPSHVFTTHTPVPAGIDRFNPALVTHYFADYAPGLGLDSEGFLALGRERVEDKNEAFSMAVLALRASKWCNGVSKLHGVVSRKMWARVWPDTPVDDVPIGHVTNGVHPGSWIAPAMSSLYTKHLGEDWAKRPQDASVWTGVDKIPDADLWSARRAARAKLVAWAKGRAGVCAAKDMGASLDADALTVGFARRFAGYKRATLLFRDPARLEKLVSGPRPVQFLIAGKSHPGDSWGKHLIRDIVEFARTPKARGRVLFLEDYGIDVARELVRGCDVWLNNPIRGLEASGTSGMKAAMNGVLNASILDGWWDEGYAEDVGYKIPDRGIYPSDEPNDEREDFESAAMYRLFEEQIVPDFYTRDAGGVATAWTRKMKACIRALSPEFSTHRMVADYATKYYFPAHAAASKLASGDLREARELSDHIDRYRQLWSGVRVRTVDCAAAPGADEFAVAAGIKLGQLAPEEVLVQVYHGRAENGNVPVGTAVAMTCKGRASGEAEDGLYHFSARFKAPQAASGGYGLVVRVLPGDPRLVTPFIPGLVSLGTVVGVGPELGGSV